MLTRARGLIADDVGWRDAIGGHTIATKDHANLLVKRIAKRDGAPQGNFVHRVAAHDWIGHVEHGEPQVRRLPLHHANAIVCELRLQGVSVFGNVGHRRRQLRQIVVLA